MPLAWPIVVIRCFFWEPSLVFNGSLPSIWLNRVIVLAVSLVVSPLLLCVFLKENAMGLTPNNEVLAIKWCSLQKKEHDLCTPPRGISRKASKQPDRSQTTFEGCRKLICLLATTHQRREEEKSVYTTENKRNIQHFFWYFSQGQLNFIFFFLAYCAQPTTRSTHR